MTGLLYLSWPRVVIFNKCNRSWRPPSHHTRWLSSWISQPPQLSFDSFLIETALILRWIAKDKCLLLQGNFIPDLKNTLCCEIKCSTKSSSAIYPINDPLPVVICQAKETWVYYSKQANIHYQKNARKHASDLRKKFWHFIWFIFRKTIILLPWICNCKLATTCQA